MKIFDYHAPETLLEAIRLHAGGGPDSHLLAGGTDILVKHRNRAVSIESLVDIKHIAGLRELTLDEETGLTIGAAATCGQLRENRNVGETYAGLVDAVSQIGGVAIQNRATVGGNVCNAAPSADSVPPLIVENAVCVVSGPAGERTIPVAEFCTGPGKTLLESGEILVSIRVPVPTSSTGGAYQRFIPRHEMDIAVVGVAASVTLDGDKHQIIKARVALGAVAATPLLVREAGDVLIGLEAVDDSYAKAAELCREAAAPITDLRGSEKLRRHLIGVLVIRVLRKAAERARLNGATGRA